ncbi:hypothetical protein BGZ50_004627 [Haplosporangium sp. Z 11]|nr:hypothetical protein BGZ50_004627 [Haplosporangium sp. Z 11]
MTDTIAQDATPHPRYGQGSRRRTTGSHDNESNEDSDLDISSTRPRSQQSTNSHSGHSKGIRSSIFGHNKSRGSDDEESDDDFDEVPGMKRKGRRRRRISASASHLLERAPSVPDLRFDHNYRKALDQIYVSHAQESAQAIAMSGSSKQQQHKVSVPSIAARVTVMTLRDIIIMPFIHGFFWGFGTILLTMASQRSLGYHLNRTWNRIFGGSSEDKPMVIRGEPARVRRFGNTSLGNVGLMNAGSGSPGFGRPTGHVY